jgi:hypothetical protein
LTLLCAKKYLGSFAIAISCLRVVVYAQYTNIVWNSQRYLAALY